MSDHAHTEEGRKPERSRTAVFIGTPCEVIDRYQSRCHIHQSVSCRVSCDTARPISFRVPVQDSIKEVDIDKSKQDGSEEGQLFDSKDLPGLAYRKSSLKGNMV